MPSRWLSKIIAIYVIMFNIIERGEEKDNEGSEIDLTPSPSPKGEGNWSAGDGTVGG